MLGVEGGREERIRGTQKKTLNPMAQWQKEHKHIRLKGILKFCIDSL